MDRIRRQPGRNSHRKQHPHLHRVDDPPVPLLHRERHLIRHPVGGVIPHRQRHAVPQPRLDAHPLRDEVALALGDLHFEQNGLRHPHEHAGSDQHGVTNNDRDALQGRVCIEDGSSNYVVHPDDIRDKVLYPLAYSHANVVTDKVEVLVKLKGGVANKHPIRFGVGIVLRFVEWEWV